MGFNTSDTSTWFICDILQTDYDCTFAIETQEELKVFKIEIVNDTRTELNLNVDFTLSNVGYDYEPPLNKVVKITLLIPLSSDYKLYAYSDKDYKINIPFSSGNPPTTVELEDSLMRIERQVQQANTRIIRTITIDEFLDINGIVVQNWNPNEFLMVNETGTAIICMPGSINFSVIDEETPTLIDWLVFGDISDSENIKKVTIEDLNTVLLHSSLLDAHSILGSSAESNGGLFGGGDLTAYRNNWKLNIDGNLTEKINPILNDFVAIADSEDSYNPKKVTINNLSDIISGDIDFDSVPEDVITSSDYIIFGDISDSENTKKDTVGDLNTVLLHSSLSDAHSVSGYSTGVNSGLEGGGDLSSGRDLKLSVNNLATKATPTVSDYLALQDISDSNITKKATVGNIVALASGSLDFDSITEADIASGDYIVFGDISDSGNTKKDTVGDLNAILDHDSLLNTHSRSGYSTLANSGLSGGGDLSAGRDLVLDINNLTTKVTPVSTDELSLNDIVGGNITKKATIGTIIGENSSSFDFTNVTEDVSTTSDYFLFEDISDSDSTKRDSIGDLNAILDHDSLLNTHNRSGYSTLANSGLSGGGDLSAGRDLVLDIDNLTVKATPVLADSIGIIDTEALNVSKKATLTSLNGVLDHDSLLNYVANEHIDHSSISVQASTNKFLASTNSDLTSTVEFGLNRTNGLAKTSIVDNDEIVVFDSEDTNNPKRIAYSVFKSTVTEIATVRNFVVNPCGCIARRPIGTFSTSVQDSGIIKGETERFGGRVYSASANIGGGTFRKGSNAITSVQQSSHRFFNVTLTGVGSFIELYYRMPSSDASKFYNQVASFSASVACSSGSNIPYVFYINKADVKDDFSSVSNIATSGIFTAVNPLQKYTFDYENISMGDCRNGIEFIIRLNCDSISGVTFEHSEVQIVLGNTAGPYINNVTFEEMLNQCNRFYYKTYNYDIKEGTSSSVGAYYGYSYNSSRFYYATCRYLKEMFSQPTITIYSTSTGASGKIYDIDFVIDKTASVSNIGANGFELGGSAMTANQYHGCHYVADAELY